MIVFPEQFTSLTHHFSCSIEYELLVPCGAKQSRNDVEHAHFNTVTMNV